MFVVCVKSLHISTHVYSIFFVMKMNEAALTVEDLVTESLIVPSWRLYRINRQVQSAERTIWHHPLPIGNFFSLSNHEMYIHMNSIIYSLL